jgi:hypothetical protein
MILETFIRCFVNPDALDASIALFKALLGDEGSLRFDYPEFAALISHSIARGAAPLTSR